MACKTDCRYRQLCRLTVKEGVYIEEDQCPEYMHWDDMALDAESARRDYQDKDELPFDDPEEDEWDEDADETI